MDPLNDKPQTCQGCGAPMEHTDHTLCPSCVAIENGRKPCPPKVVHDESRRVPVTSVDPDGPLGCVILILAIVASGAIGALITILLLK